MAGVKIQHNLSVHLAFPKIPFIKVDGDFPRVLRLIGFDILEFSLEEAVQNAEKLVKQAESRKFGRRALNELLSLSPNFIHHPRVQNLFKNTLSKGDYRFSPPPGRPRGKGGYLDDFVVFSAVNCLRQNPFRMSLRGTWTELADKWKSSYSSVRDAYKRACQRFKPLAIIDLSPFPQNGEEEINIKDSATSEKIRLQPLERITREQLTNDLQLVEKIRLTPSGTIYVKYHYEFSGEPCILIVQPELRTKGASRIEPLNLK